jgi:predicted phosphodiesterase
MRVFATSDLHVDYDVNARWIRDLSAADYRDDVLILAGDVTDTISLLEWTLGTLSSKFRKVLFVPGNHDLWVVRQDRVKSSLQKFDDVRAVAEATGASMELFRDRGVSIVPLLSWYDYSFGEPSEELRSVWMDYVACRWPVDYSERQIADHFVALNDGHVAPAGDLVITYSHFLPRIDVMPGYMPGTQRFLYPVLGCSRLDGQARTLGARIHVYGHSHINRRVHIDGVTYINNAFGYPSETAIAAKRLLCIHEC